MITREDIEKLKARKPSNISSTIIAEACEGNISASDVRRFFTFRTVPMDKKLEIVKKTNKLIKEQEEKIKEALEA